MRHGIGVYMSFKGRVVIRVQVIQLNRRAWPWSGLSTGRTRLKFGSLHRTARIGRDEVKVGVQWWRLMPQAPVGFQHYHLSSQTKDLH